ncbi:hypothetical protein POTOM_017479 [Populus tomentosa]|uniref:NADP-dependent oxidoreductase domain-containing protein n=1 Tax=Populus tomentosa TaxID=118781 RepID=A0A8X7ZUQ6_POPTO|nr:hypothetical protein POTOM_017479 [Populus tomentosa]
MKKDFVGCEPENLTQPDILASWREMEALYESGKAHVVGVSNFSSKKLGDLLACWIIIAALFSVIVVAAADNGLELLHQITRPREHWSSFCTLCCPSKSRAQVALRWGLQMGSSVLPKSINKERLVTRTTFVHGTYGAYMTLDEL